MSSVLQRIERQLDQWGRFIIQWWIWPAVMLSMGLTAITAAWVVYPGEGEQLMALGRAFGEECEFKVQFGFGCPGCGMTRSWVYSARGQILRGMDYNAAGSVLFLWLALGVPLGGLRLLLRKPGFLRTPPVLFLVGVGGWVVLMMGVFFGRMAGINPLP